MRRYRKRQQDEIAEAGKWAKWREGLRVSELVVGVSCVCAVVAS